MAPVRTIWAGQRLTGLTLNVASSTALARAGSFSKTSRLSPLTGHEAAWDCARLCFSPHKDISVCGPSVDSKGPSSNLRGSLWTQLRRAGHSGCSSLLGLLRKEGGVGQLPDAPLGPWFHAGTFRRQEDRLPDASLSAVCVAGGVSGTFGILGKNC